MKFTLALAQIDTRLGDQAANLEKHLEMIRSATKQGADLVVFPELSLSGYFLMDLAPTVALKAEDENPIFQALLAESQKIDIVVGFVEEDARHNLYIAAAYLSLGEIVHVHRKIYLPTYGMFDDQRFFASGNKIRAFDTRFGRIGLLICEDFWHASPPYLLFMDGAEVQIYISASPSRGVTEDEQLESARWVGQVSASYASLYTSFVANTNRVGYEDGINFWGGATLYDPNGDLVARGPMLDEALTLAEVDLGELRRARLRLPLLSDERPELVQRELNRILQKD
jgi:predicted amidohydrolase